MLPLIYIHFGEIPKYLLVSMKQASLLNKDIILLTDTDFKADNVRCFPINEFNKDVESLNLLYKHMSTNSREFEMICIKRWFILRNFMNDQNIEVVYYSDSDVMIYEDLSIVYDQYKEFDACYTLTEFQDNYRWSASACCSYWKKNAINKFCDFVVNAYASDKIGELELKWKYHLDNKIPGGICDMTLLYLFSKEINFFPLSKVLNEACFDQNMLDPENYYKNEYKVVNRNDGRKQKDINWKNGSPYGFNLIMKKEIKFIVLTEYAKLIGQKKTIIGSIKSKIKLILKRG